MEQAPTRTPALPVWEFVCIIAGLMALNAMAIDIMLPALAQMQEAFALQNDNDRQLVVIVYVLGLGFSQIFYGPLMDRFGRKPVLGVALAAYILAGAYCVFAPNFTILLWARFLQGVSAGATRVVAVTIVRDFYSGRRMAEIMSLTMMVFMAVPVLAPYSGQVILGFFHEWTSVFWALVIYACIFAAWGMIRLPETLAKEARTPLNPGTIARTYRAVFSIRVVTGYMLASAFAFAIMFGFISASEQIFSDVFDKADTFPILFGVMATGMAAASLINSRLVMKYGMRRLSHIALVVLIAGSFLHALVSHASFYGFWVFYPLMAVSFICIGFIGSNFNSIAMEPLGKHAGSGSALYGFATTFGSGAVGFLIANSFDGTTAPVFTGHAIAGLLALLFVYYAERGRLFGGE